MACEQGHFPGYSRNCVHFQARGEGSRQEEWENEKTLLFSLPSCLAARNPGEVSVLAYLLYGTALLTLLC